MPVRKGEQKGLRVSDFALLMVVFKWHRGSEGVNISMLTAIRCQMFINEKSEVLFDAVNDTIEGVCNC